MIKAGPKVFDLPKHRPVFETVERVSHDPREAAFLRMQHYRSLADGAEVSGVALGYLENPDDQHEWARLVGGSFLMTSQKLYDDAVGSLVMTHRIDLPELMNERNEIMTQEAYDELAIRMVKGVRKLSANIAESAALGVAITTGRHFQIARAFGKVGTLLSSYPLQLEGVSNQFGAQHIALHNVEKTYEESLLLSGRLQHELSVSQLADRRSRLANYILQSDAVSSEVALTYDLSLSEIERTRSRTNR